MSEEELPLAALLSRALKTGSKAIMTSSAEDQNQDLVVSALSDLHAVAARINAIGLFSPNETVEDLTARDMLYLFVPFAQAELTGRLRTTDPSDRIAKLQDAELLFKRFCLVLDQYEIVPKEDKSLWSGAQPTAAASHRELKIKQLKNEMTVRGMINTLVQSRGRPEIDHSTNLDTIMALLPTTSAGSQDDGDDDGTRQVTLLTLRLIWAKTQAELSSMEKELEVLRNIPSPLPGPPAPEPPVDNTWRLDPSLPTAGRGPLIDSKGKPLQTFTFLPSGATSDRQTIHSQVFRPDHRLPTMTIDEYLEEERRRGNIISGGGPASLAQPTSSEQLAMDAEQDGTLFGEQKSEDKRVKDETWAQYTDVHRKGEGNTMNRG